jgi:hypothetical protein
MAHGSIVLRYVDESSHLYRVQLRSERILTVPKRRAVPAPYPPPEPGPLLAANRWLACAIIGLLPAGLGAVICAPVAVFLALRAFKDGLSDEDRAHGKAMSVIGGGLFLSGLLLTLMIIPHLPN